jgi:hypothetical protein
MTGGTVRPCPDVYTGRSEGISQAGVSHGIRAVHATERSAHRHQYGQDRHRRTGAARRTRHAHHLHQRQPSGPEGTHRRRDAAVKHQRVASRHPPTSASGAVAARTSQRTLLERPFITTNVRFGSQADICGAIRHVRFTPNSEHKSGLRQTVLSGLPPKADACGAKADVR